MPLRGSAWPFLSLSHSVVQVICDSGFEASTRHLVRPGILSDSRPGRLGASANPAESCRCVRLDDLLPDRISDIVEHLGGFRGLDGCRGRGGHAAGPRRGRARQPQYHLRGHHAAPVQQRQFWRVGRRRLGPPSTDTISITTMTLSWFGGAN